MRIVGGQDSGRVTATDRLRAIRVLVLDGRDLYEAARLVGANRPEVLQPLWNSVRARLKTRGLTPVSLRNDAPTLTKDESLRVLRAAGRTLT